MHLRVKQSNPYHSDFFLFLYNHMLTLVIPNLLINVMPFFFYFLSICKASDKAAIDIFSACRVTDSTDTGHTPFFP